MRTALIVFLLAFCFSAFSQQVVKEFGTITKDEIELKFYDKDPEAKALILYDRGETLFYDNKDALDIRFTRHTRIKIFDKSASKYAEVNIPLYRNSKGRREKLTSVEAITYNLVNGILQEKAVSPSAIYEETINENWIITKFVFPDVQDGSILDLKYVLESPFKFKLPEWRFQDKIPTLYSEYEVRIVPFYEYVFIKQGITDFDYRDKYISKKDRFHVIEFNDYVFTFGLKDIPAFESEDYISSINDYIIRLQFQLAKSHDIYGLTYNRISTWPELNKELMKNDHFGKFRKKCQSYAEEVLETEVDITGLKPEEQYPILINYVKDHFEWNNRSMKFSTQTPKHFFETKSGNSAEINLFLIALLNAAGVDAEPVILSTRNHGKIPFDYPIDQFTNYVVVQINTDDSYFFTDATDPLLNYDRLPENCLNGKGLLVIKSKEPIWLSMVRDWNSTENTKLTLTVDTLSRDVNASVVLQSTEYDSRKNREQFMGDTLDIKTYYSSRIGEISKTVSSDYKDPSKPYTITVDGLFETDRIAHNIVIRPFLNLQPTQNSFTQKERNYPIDFIYPWKKEFESTLTVPYGYTVSSQPKELEIENELVEIKLHSELEGNLLTVKGVYNFKKSIYEASDYHEIKRYFDQIIDHFNQPIIIEKSK